MELVAKTTEVTFDERLGLLKIVISVQRPFDSSFWVKKQLLTELLNQQSTYTFEGEVQTIEAAETGPCRTFVSTIKATLKQPQDIEAERIQYFVQRLEETWPDV